ncbi:hypothetical protein ZIOFF_072721 [Zingiber officinale]|uniref:Uncharacterized protein n=1 Tax=Zingiber officinale TaxID=94328 RepID=A0A8J5E9S5_ZINOF|nr:hypothetical protein ZIOFF_072721 [Zingiber officinale]
MNLLETEYTDSEFSETESNSYCNSQMKTSEVESKFLDFDVHKWKIIESVRNSTEILQNESAAVMSAEMAETRCRNAVVMYRLILKLKPCLVPILHVDFAVIMIPSPKEISEIIGVIEMLDLWLLQCCYQRMEAGQHFKANFDMSYNKLELCKAGNLWGNALVLILKLNPGMQFSNVINSAVSQVAPAEGDRDDAGAVLPDMEERRLGEVEVRARGVAPATIVAGVVVGWRAEVGGGDDDGAREARLGVIGALQLVAGAIAELVVEQHCAEHHRVGAIAHTTEEELADYKAGEDTHFEKKEYLKSSTFLVPVSDPLIRTISSSSLPIVRARRTSCKRSSSYAPQDVITGPTIGSVPSVLPPTIPTTVPRPPITSSVGLSFPRPSSLSSSSARPSVPTPQVLFRQAQGLPSLLGQNHHQELERPKTGKANFEEESKRLALELQAYKASEEERWEIQRRQYLTSSHFKNEFVSRIVGNLTHSADGVLKYPSAAVDAEARAFLSLLCPSFPLASPVPKHRHHFSTSFLESCPSAVFPCLRHRAFIRQHSSALHSLGGYQHRASPVCNRLRPVVLPPHPVVPLEWPALWYHITTSLCFGFLLAQKERGISNGRLVRSCWIPATTAQNSCAGTISALPSLSRSLALFSLVCVTERSFASTRVHSTALVDTSIGRRLSATNSGQSCFHLIRLCLLSGLLCGITLPPVSVLGFCQHRRNGELVDDWSEVVGFQPPQHRIAGYFLDHHFD